MLELSQLGHLSKLNLIQPRLRAEAMEPEGMWARMLLALLLVRPRGGTFGEDAGSGIGSGTDSSIRSTKSTESTGETTTCFAYRVPTNGEQIVIDEAR